MEFPPWADANVLEGLLSGMTAATPPPSSSTTTNMGLPRLVSLVTDRSKIPFVVVDIPAAPPANAPLLLLPC